MAPPPRNLDGLSLTAEPGLTHLAAVPGFGQAWARLPANASLRDQMVAHEADLRLIYAPDREVDCMPVSEYTRYGAATFGTALSAKSEHQVLESLYRLQGKLSRTWEQVGTRLEARWVGLGENGRERVLLRALEDYDDAKSKWVWLLLADEITLSLAAGDGHSFSDLVKRLVWDPKRPPKSFKSLPSPKWDRWFGVDGLGEPSIPRPRAFQSAMISQRQGVLFSVCQSVLNDLAGARVPPRPAQHKPLSKKESEEQFLMFKMAMTAQAGSSKEEQKTLKLALASLKGPQDVSKLFDKEMNIERLPRCENCFLKAPEGSGIKLLFCQRCKKKDVVHQYCSAVCQHEDWPTHKPYCGKKDDTLYDTPVFPSTG